MKSKEINVVYDNITNYGLTIINNDMYLIKGGKVMPLSTIIIKERKANWMKKAVLNKEYNNKINVLKVLLLEEGTSRHKMDLNINI